jgi:hypothetical protein
MLSKWQESQARCPIAGDKHRALVAELAQVEGISRSRLADVKFMRTTRCHPRGPVARRSWATVGREPVQFSKLLIALWRYVTQGEVPEVALLKAA